MWKYIPVYKYNYMIEWKLNIRWGSFLIRLLLGIQLPGWLTWHLDVVTHIVIDWMSPKRVNKLRSCISIRKNPSVFQIPTSTCHYFKTCFTPSSWRCCNSRYTFIVGTYILLQVGLLRRHQRHTFYNRSVINHFKQYFIAGCCIKKQKGTNQLDVNSEHFQNRETKLGQL